MCIVDSALEFGSDTGDFDDFFRRSVGAGDVKKSCRQAERAFRHGIADQLPHLFQLGISRFPVLPAHDHFPDVAVADEMYRIHADAIRLPLSEAILHFVRAAAVKAEDDGSDSLVQVRDRITTIILVEHSMAVGIDESRCNPVSIGINRFGRTNIGRIGLTDEYDPGSGNSDVRHDRSTSRTVEQEPVFYQDVNLENITRRGR